MNWLSVPATGATEGRDDGLAVRVGEDDVARVETARVDGLAERHLHRLKQPSGTSEKVAVTPRADPGAGGGGGFQG